MFSSFFKPFYYFILLLCILIISLSCFFIPVCFKEQMWQEIKQEPIYISSFGFAWPIPGYTTITSYFGKRTSPTLGASSFHKGLDIAAPEGTILIATIDGEITFADFLRRGRLYHNTKQS